MKYLTYTRMQQSSGYIERTDDGRFEGALDIEGVDISPIEGVFFQEGAEPMLWLKRKPVLEYVAREMSYIARAAEPRWEAYLKKGKGGAIAYSGIFPFLHFRFSIVGFWDTAIGDKKRLNLFVERLPMQQQTIINSINERYRRK